MVESHRIVINNFRPGQVVLYPLVIIKGDVKNNNDSCQKMEGKIFVDSSSFQIVDHKFKALVELKLGLNLLTFSFCCTEYRFTLNYSRRKTKFSVLPLYIICQGDDGHFQAPSTIKNDVESACKRITLGTKLLQSVFAEKLDGGKTFQLQNDCQIFYSNLNYLEARKMSQQDLWATIGCEIINCDFLDHDRVKFLGFLSCTRYRGDQFQDNFIHQDIVKITEGYVALGGGGLALFGSACLYTWPENLSQVVKYFQNSTSIDKKKFMDDSCYRGTWGACFSTTLGSVLHELCHTFDLGHTESGIMGRGFDNIHRVFLNGNEKKFQKSVIEFREEFEPELLSERLKDRKKSFLVTEVSHEEDFTFWTDSCGIFLSYHKWFNDFDEFASKMVNFDSGGKFVRSSGGLRVIEIREEDNGMVQTSWIFDGRVLKFSFQLPEDVKSGIMFVEDNFGNILKQKL